VWQQYRAESAEREHEHCELCWAKFMDPDFSEDHRRFVAEHPDVLMAGYTTATEKPQRASRHWVCEPCMAYFADEFGWSVSVR
jgi:hypothetical protein